MADRPEECALQLDDYFECLHHTKECELTLNALVLLNKTTELYGPLVCKCRKWIVEQD
ncbi:4585_t:CDS:2 [Dentiscutata heterogama]|uniref:4585_t:CDS:1 n=1 Tax=Dentiscutata heterogama TaxID=1316150 RepID=A0ACA9K2Z3_9GLOM|nr:4585_t:CDS:2 [Dentiscutata heterogama]